MHTTIRDRIGASAGAAFVLLIVVGNQLNTAGTDQSGHASGAQVLKDAAHQASSSLATFGTVLEILGFVAFIGFLGYVLDAFGRRPDAVRGSFAGGAAIIAGATMLAIKLGSGVPLGVLFLDRKHLSPQLAQLLNDFGNVAFIVCQLPYAVFVFGLAVALHQRGRVGKPTAYLGEFIGVAGVVLTLLAFNDPTNANPTAFMLGLVWTLVISVRLAVRPGSPASQDAPTVARTPVPA